MKMLTKFCRESEWSLSFSYENTYRRNKPEAGQDGAPRLTFSFIKANW